MLPPGQQNSQIEETLERSPDEVAKALFEWRRATLDRESLEARLYLRFKAQNPDITATELKARVNESDERYQAVLQEITLESTYNAKQETLLAAKKIASLRTAF